MDEISFLGDIQKHKSGIRKLYESGSGNVGDVCENVWKYVSKM